MLVAPLMSDDSHFYMSSSSHQYHSGLSSSIQTEVGISFRLFAKRTAPKLLAAFGDSDSDSEFDSDVEVFPLGNQLSDDNDTPRFLKLIMTPRALSCICMALSMALHFGGYEFARSSSLALFTSKQRGFTHAGAFPLAMALVSPFSVLLLLGYGRQLEHYGPRVALRHSTLGSILFLLTAGLGLLWWAPDLHGTLLSRCLVALTFIFQNSYAHLLYAQQWSFLGSTMTPAEGSRWFASIAGLSSLASTLTGTTVSSLVERVGLPGLLLCTTFTLTGSLLLGDYSYRLAEHHGFDPAEELKQKQQSKQESSSKASTNRVAKAVQLFRKVPTLGALFGETLSFQSLSTILNVCLVTKLKASIVDDVARAAWTGKFYAIVNAVSGSFQFLIIPLLVKNFEPSIAWKLMPLVPAMCSIFQTFSANPSLYLLAFSFFACKCMDYSFRGVSNEMVYVPLDFESRFVGKEIIGVFGNRFGKSGMSLILSGLTYTFGNFGISQLSFLSTLASGAWMGCSWYLSGLIPKQAEAQRIVDERRKHAKEETKKES